MTKVAQPFPDSEQGSVKIEAHGCSKEEMEDDHDDDVFIDETPVAHPDDDIIPHIPEKVDRNVSHQSTLVPWWQRHKRGTLVWGCLVLLVLISSIAVVVVTRTNDHERAPSKDDNTDASPTSTTSDEDEDPPSDDSNVIPTNDENAYWQPLGQPLTGEFQGDHAGEALDLSADGTILAVGEPWYGNYGRVQVWKWDASTSSWTPLGNPLTGHERTGDRLGSAVALSADGNILATGTNVVGNALGYVRIHQWDETSGSWVPLGEDIMSTDDLDGFGSVVQLSADGHAVAVASPTHPILRPNEDAQYHTGRVQVFDWTGTEWIQRGNDLEGEDEWDKFGTSLALSSDGTVLAAGTPHHEDFVGHVKVVEWDGMVWRPRGPPFQGTSPMDFFGEAIALSSDGSVLTVGSYTVSQSSNVIEEDEFSDKVDAWKWDGSYWHPMGDPIVGEAKGEGWALSLALAKDDDGRTILAIGADLHADENPHSGYVTVFEWTNTNEWVVLGETLHGDNVKDSFGSSLALSKDGIVLAVGAFLHDNGDTSSYHNSGHVSVWAKNTNQD